MTEKFFFWTILYPILPWDNPYTKYIHWVSENYLKYDSLRLEINMISGYSPHSPIVEPEGLFRTQRIVFL